MSQHAQILIQVRLNEILTGDSQLMSLIKGVFDNVPDQQAFPYVTIGDSVLGDFGTKNTDGFEGDVTIHTWSQAFGKLEAMKISDRIYALLHNIDLNIEGFSTITFRCTLNQIIKDPDNKTNHGIQTYRLILGG